MTRKAKVTRRSAGKTKRAQPSVKRQAPPNKTHFDVDVFDEGIRQDQNYAHRALAPLPAEQPTVTKASPSHHITFHFDDEAPLTKTVPHPSDRNQPAAGERVTDPPDMADMGEKTAFPSGATRSGHLVERYDLMSPEANRRRALVYGRGAKEHGDRNWEQGMPISECVNRAIRHLNLYMAGDRSEDHLGHAAVNCDFVMHYEQHNPECLNIPSRRPT